jgi:hypothetical protein
MKDINVEAMLHGVQKSAIFVLFANSNTLSRYFVLLEFHEAIMLKKMILILRELDDRHGAPTDDDGKFNLELVFANPNDEGYKGGVKTPDEVKDHLRNLFVIEPEFFIPHFRRKVMVQAELETLANLAGFGVETSPTILVSGLRGLVVCAHVAFEHASDVMKRLIGRGVVKATSLEDCDFIVLFLTDFFFVDADRVVLVREVLALGIQIVLVTSTSVQQGAVLNGTKTFDYNKVMNQAPGDLKVLSDTCEGIPYHEGQLHVIIGNAMIDMVLSQVQKKKVTAKSRTRLSIDASVSALVDFALASFEEKEALCIEASRGESNVSIEGDICSEEEEGGVNEPSAAIVHNQEKEKKDKAPAPNIFTPFMNSFYGITL